MCDIDLIDIFLKPRKFILACVSRMTKIQKTFFIFSQLIFAVIGFFAYEFKDLGISLVPMILLAAPAYYAVIRSNWKRGLVFILLLSIYATFIEALSVQTGWPYGFFEYNESLGYKILDLVPWAVGFGWVPLVIGAFIISTKIFRHNWQRFLFGCMILVWSDLILDPGAVALEFWAWSNPGGYYTVPFQNYLGWIFSAIIGGSAFFLFGFHSEPRKISNIGVFTLLYGNAFWIGVTITVGFLVPVVLGFLFQGFILWFLFEKRFIE